MPRMTVDYEEMVRFARLLLSTRDALRQRQAGMISEFNTLHEAWRDAKYDAFEKVYADAMKELDQFSMQAEEFAQYLQRKARKVQEYMDTQYR